MVFVRQNLTSYILGKDNFAEKIVIQGHLYVPWISGTCCSLYYALLSQFFCPGQVGQMRIISKPKSGTIFLWCTEKYCTDLGAHNIPLTCVAFYPFYSNEYIRVCSWCQHAIIARRRRRLTGHSNDQAGANLVGERESVWRRGIPSNGSCN